MQDVTMEGTRRQILKGAAVGGLAVTGLAGVGSSVAGAQSTCDITCTDGIYVKYELVEDDGTCTFEEETDTGIFGDSLTIEETKDDDPCEPLSVSWDESEFVAGTLVAKGGTDCETVDDPEGSYDSSLENGGGRRAAISNLQFCVERNDRVYAQIDFVEGDVIEDLCEDQYSSRRISAIHWGSAEGELGTQGQFDGSWEIDDGAGTVSVHYNPDDYDQQVALAVYEVSDPVFQDNGLIDFSETRCRQTLVDSDIDEVGDQDGTLTADLPTP